MAVDSRLAAAGALGTLVLFGTPLEAAATLGGAMRPLPSGDAVRVRLLGRPPAWMTGEDLAFERDADNPR
jgi:aconitase A